MNRCFFLLFFLALFPVWISPLLGQRGGLPPGGEPANLTEPEPEDLDSKVGTARIPDRAAFEELSYKGDSVGPDSYLIDLEFVKFIIKNSGTPDVKVYFMNTKNYQGHPPWMRMVGIDRGGAVRGALTYMPRIASPNGDPGLYIFDFQPSDSYLFEEIQTFQNDLMKFAPVLKGRIAFHPLPGNLDQYKREKALYDASEVAVYLDEDLYKNIVYLPLNPAVSFGRLRLMDEEIRPSPRDIVICRTLPNQMPRVAGVISEVRQTPLSHVNLRAIQDKTPNAFIRNASQNEQIQSLLGKLVRYQVTTQVYRLREASQAEVDRHFAKIRPAKPQKPARDLSKTTIESLKNIQFKDASGFGVKTANLAAMRRFDFPPDTVPDGFGIPFHFYVEFMKHNRLDAAVNAILDDPNTQNDRERLRKELKKLRDQIKKGNMPPWMSEAVAAVQRSFPEGISIRCRSSTNNEDLPGFSGAGLYDSFTHNPDEGHLSKSIQQVFASLWNFRAFDEREFYRIDHKLAAMGVLLHPNFKGEKANGVAVTEDVLYETQETQGNYYLNTQIGEDLVTNPEELSTPEEILLGWYAKDGHTVVRQSNQAPNGETLLEETHMRELRNHLKEIHNRFAELYGREREDRNFAMEIEYKITESGKLVIKQARPWVFSNPTQPPLNRRADQG